jgi:hypothetical protein
MTPPHPFLIHMAVKQSAPCAAARAVRSDERRFHVDPIVSPVRSDALTEHGRDRRGSAAGTG